MEIRDVVIKRDPNNNKISGQVSHFDNEIVATRKLISKCCEERKLLTRNERLTRKMRRSSIEIQKSCDVISIYSLNGSHR